MEQLDGIAVGLRGCPRPIEWSKERQDGGQEQEHEVGQCDSVVGVFFENLRNPARDRRAGLMRQFPTGQVYSTKVQCLPRYREPTSRN